MATLDDRLDGLIGAKAARALDESFGIRRVDDLLRHYPRGYTEGKTVRSDGDERPVREGEHITLLGTISKTKTGWMKPNPKYKRRREYHVITLSDSRPAVSATFFNATYLKNSLVEGERVMLSGEVEFYHGNIRLTHPEFLILSSRRTIGTKSLATIAETASSGGELDLSAFERTFFPIYPSAKNVQSWDIYACVRQVLDVLDPIDDPLPESLRRQRNLVDEDTALRAIHIAEDDEQRRRARDRLTFDEAMGLEMALVQRRYSELSQTGPPAPRRDGGLRAALHEQLPFELTAGQRDVLAVLSAEIEANRPMNRMLQGEVGSGKTILSVLAMLQLVDAGYQCALLAPTEVLAAQHARSIRDILGPLAMAGELGAADGATRVALLTGSMSAAQKRVVREEVARGEAGIVVGTHALLQDTVDFDNLGMVVIDEQHRFGVEQRNLLRAKTRPGVTPHLLVMTATPIPRTVALTIYGDLETSTLRELPRGRQPIATTAIFTNERKGWLERAWQRLIEEVAAGRQAYVVASRIDETEKEKAGDDDERRGLPPPATVKQVYDALHAGVLKGLRLGLMHGRLPADEKDAVMTAFRDGEIDVLVSTTVIEVGVDVPNATVMVIADADRFGISQLHQLRGRIGRGSHPSVCLLVSNMPSASRAGTRIQAVADTLDGFALADLDMRERREGDVLGRNQSGVSYGLKLLSLHKHQEIIETSRELCEDIYLADPELVDHRGLDTLARRFTDSDSVEYLDKS